LNSTGPKDIPYKIDGEKPDDLIPKLFKAEYSNLVAVLCNFYGFKNIQQAEDIVSEAFIQAMKNWSHKGIPDNPKAWLRRVASNKATDYHRRNKLQTEKIFPNYKIQNSDQDSAIEFNDSIIADSQLKTIFVVCHPELSIESQICLALRILSGFNIDEIATALLSNKESVNKKLYRGKKKLRAINPDIDLLDGIDLENRIDGVLRILYLIFNEGYYRTQAKEAISQDLCWEALRLSLLLTQQKSTNLPRLHALIALMCFHASRLGTRIGDQNQLLLLDQQDRKGWNKELIVKGQQYLNTSARGPRVSKYHLEAAIAYWHTTDDEKKWDSILRLYNKLLQLEYSPHTAMNRTYAFAMSHAPDLALREALKLKLDTHHLYHSLLAELYRMTGDSDKQSEHLDQAIKMATNPQEIQLLQQKKAKLHR